MCPKEEGKEKDKIELRSEEVQEILGSPPRWMIRYGITVILIVIFGLFVSSFFFKYPDIIQASITVTTENLPVGIMTKTSGRIDTFFVTEKEKIKKGDRLAILENPASFSDILQIKKIVDDYSETGSHEIGSIPSSLQLGDIQPAYSSFLKSFNEYYYFVTASYHKNKIKVIQKQIATQKRITKKSQNQLKISEQQLLTASEVFAIDSTLYIKNALSNVEYKNAKNIFLQQQQAYELAKLNIDNQEMSILQLEQVVFDLEQQYKEQQNQRQTELSNALDHLQTQIKNWEQSYLLSSPVDGIVTMPKFWQKNQNVSAGEILLTIVPEKEAKIVGKILLPPKGAGKVKEGQIVNVKFDNYPYMEFGMVRVKINNIALVPLVQKDTKGYVLEVSFPNKLKTTYGNELVFTQEMQGTAEIITEDLRLIDRFLNPIRAILKK